MFVTSEPHAQVAACGGQIEKGRWSGYTASCLVLDQINKRWDESRMGNLTMERTLSAVATLDHVGVFIVGGEGTNNLKTSEFLAAGSMEWQEGPALRVNMRAPCAVTITATSFLAIYENNIHEFDVAIAGPTSSAGWRKAEHWPLLKTSRTSQPGCARWAKK